MRVWFPTIRTGSGSDVFVERLVAGLKGRGVDAQVEWLPHWAELVPLVLRVKRAPQGTCVIHAPTVVVPAVAKLGLPVVTTVHHLVHDPMFAPYRSAAQAIYHRLHLRRLELKAISCSAAVAVVSPYVAMTVKEFSGRKDVSVIHNWVNTSRYAPRKEVENTRSRAFRLLMVGNSSRRKGVDLLQGFLKELGPEYELRRTGGLRNSPIEAGDMGVRELGRLDENALIAEYQACDAVVSLSRYEGFGYSALEGMACGKPFLGFRTSGLQDVVQDGVTGFLAPSEDVAALAQLCHRLRENEGLRRELGSQARLHVLQHFSMDQAVDSYIKLYKSVSAI